MNNLIIVTLSGENKQIVINRNYILEVEEKDIVEFGRCSEILYLKNNEIYEYCVKETLYEICRMK